MKESTIKKLQFLKKLTILLPMIILIALMIYFINAFEYYDNRYYNMVYEEGKYSVNMIADSIESLRNEGFEYPKDASVFDSVVGGNIKLLSAKQGVYVNLLDLDFNVIYNGEHNDPKMPFNPFEKGTPDYYRLYSEMYGVASGETTVTYKREGMKMYWKMVPSDNSLLYIVVAVDNDEILKSVECVPIEIGLIVICSVTVISVYDSIWMRIRHNYCMYRYECEIVQERKKRKEK